MSKKSFGDWLGKLFVLGVLLVCLGLVVLRHMDILRDGNDAAVSAMTDESASYAAEEPEETAEPTPAPGAPRALVDFTPRAGADARPESVITSTSVMVDGELVEHYRADDAHKIDFGYGEDYTDMKGIVTFRGNNFRDTAQYGRTVISEKRFGGFWSQTTSGLSDSDGTYWGGSGWTGQPLIVEWPQATKQVMNMYDWAKEKDGLVEVIYATLDGNVYFMDLETGEKTRDTLFLGWSFKGAGALDPRGYPLLYVGGGVINASGSVPRVLAVSLIDGEILYTTGDYDSFAPRPSWSAFDSSPLVDAESDQLIYPGENGVIYFIKLNTKYNESAGTLTIDPEETKFTFTSSTADMYYYGMEDSAVIWRNHLLVADNGADFICLDLNTMEIDWRFDCLDDTNCTAVLEVDDTGRPYVYLSTSFHYGWRSYGTATIPVWKIDAVTGEEVWRRDYTCYSESGLSGGVQGSLALGKDSLDGILYVAMGRYPNAGDGQLLALDTETGEELWTFSSPTYAWSSPVCFYDTQGRGYVLYTSCINGRMFLLDGLTGEQYDIFPFGVTVEASPVVYNNTVVIGTRSQQLFGITLR